MIYFGYYVIAAIFFGIDQWTKRLVVQKMELGESIPVIENFLYITSHRNRGAAWGILEGQMWFFYIITALFGIGVIYYIQKHTKDKKLMGIGLGILLGGMLGNFYDRLIHKEVVDFIDTYIFGYDFPIFNVADSSLWIGIGFVFIHMMFFEKNQKDERSQAE
ncbi:lipoprotein signal peptidase [Paenibacillus nasutitermitis]|uniref:Lipoprotein signal peptidase n=2 Tax=Paenibacillus nasutitermitis TaxID=1652958 RepID=A0A916ZC85_9BACL|nr:signal peptidase II [Paenibacillus nasutitermitis]GGD85407.1 lipoprotein signal peptidase [Paenibacillus nasutitermitis]